MKRWVACCGLVWAIACDNGDVSLGNDPLESGGASGAMAEDAGTSSAPAGSGAATGTPPQTPDAGSSAGGGAGSEPGDAGPSGPGGWDGGGHLGGDGGPGFPGGPGPGVALCGSRGLPPCPNGQFCDFPPRAQCGEADAPGICQIAPAACTREFAPVCGCDGMTYGNRCTAASARVSVRSIGECGGGGNPGGGEVCGGFIGAACGQGEYCDLAQGDGCDVADGQGVCEPQPMVCQFIYMPVCGCDGLTYGNSCAAASAGMSIRHSGEC